MVLIGIVCVGPHNEMGINNRCCFDIPEDRKFFRSLIANHIVYVGRKTFESMPKSVLQLCKQVNVITRSKCENKQNDDKICFCNGIDENYIEKIKDPIYVIGGNEIFKSFQSIIEAFYVTRVNRPVKAADTYFTVDLTPYICRKSDNNTPSGDDWKIVKYTKCNYEPDIKTYPPKQKLV